MAYSKKRLVLASGSPRRRELLEMFGLPFELLPARGEETAPPGLSPEELVKHLSAGKAGEAALRLADPRAVIIGSDTVVERDGVILGKPENQEDAFAMLKSLSGRAHRVWTGLCVRQGERCRTEAECTEVYFRPLGEDEIRRYIRTGEPMDKAGAYGCQGLASLFVEKIRGDYFTVVGLPLCRLGEMLREFGVSLL